MGLLLPFDHAERELNAKLKPQLHLIHASLKLNKEVTATNVAILKTLLDDICNQMKQKDPLFDLLFNRLEYTGSYYDGLRTKKADEFDINLVLNLPFKKDEFTRERQGVLFECPNPSTCSMPSAVLWLRVHARSAQDIEALSKVSDGCPGYVCYNVSQAAEHRLLRKGDMKWVPLLLKWIDAEKRLVPDRVKRWLQSVFDRFLRTYIVPSGSCSSVDKIQPSQHGPAKTFYIILKNGLQIDVDLVPVIEFCYPSWPEGIQKKDWMANMFSKDRNWFLIPKPPTPNSHLWRLHFPNIEKKLIKDYGCVKPIIRLLKAMRDSYKWNLSSYSLKTFVMSQLVENYDAQYWHPDNQGMLFVRV
ncbi:unnamed protein product, partial [Ixodes persulcatus]